VHREIEWLQRGPKARTSKSKARIDKAHQLIGELADLNARTRTASAGIDFSSTDRKTRRLIELENVSFEIGGRMLFQDLNFILTAGMRVGLVGANGSGKTTLLRLLSRELAPTAGDISTADALQVVYFNQNRVLDPDLTLRRALAPESDSVIYQDCVIHVASWAARFMFTGEQLNQPVGRLSGGERARVPCCFSLHSVDVFRSVSKNEQPCRLWRHCELSGTANLYIFRAKRACTPQTYRRRITLHSSRISA
jgi:ATP-binding cassette subfamily F protein uup